MNLKQFLAFLSQDVNNFFGATHSIPLGGSFTMIAVKVLITLFRGLPSIVLIRLPKLLSVSFYCLAFYTLKEETSETNVIDCCKVTNHLTRYHRFVRI